MSRSLGYALTLGDADAWGDFADVACRSLDTRERVGLAYAALLALDPEEREAVAESALKAASGPLPAFLGGMDDARFWASLANRNELKAYAFAAYEALPVQDQNAFRWHVSKTEVAV